MDLNHRPSGYEPDELPNCSIPRLLKKPTFYGWGRGIRTPECQYQKLMPYRLAIPQKMLHIVCVDGIIEEFKKNVKPLRLFF